MQKARGREERDILQTQPAYKKLFLEKVFVNQGLRYTRQQLPEFEIQGGNLVLVDRIHHIVLPQNLCKIYMLFKLKQVFTGINERGKHSYPITSAFKLCADQWFLSFHPTSR